jgi:hypothetical protein
MLLLLLRKLVVPQVQLLVQAPNLCLQETGQAGKRLSGSPGHRSSQERDCGLS